MRKTLLAAIVAASCALSAQEITKTSLFPVDFQQGIYSLVEQHPGILLFSLNADGYAIKGKKIELVFYTPANIRVIGGSAFLPSGGQGKFVAEKVTTTTGTSGRLIQKMSLDPGWVRRSQKNAAPWGHKMRVYLEALPGSSAAPAGKISCHVAVNGRPEQSKSFTLNVLPPLAANKFKLKNFVTGTTELHGITVPIPGIFERNLAYWSNLSEKLQTWGTWRMRECPAENMRKLAEKFDIILMAAANSDETPRFSFTDYGFREGTRPGVPPLLDENGKIVPGGICPEYLLRDPEKIFWDKYFVDGIRELRKSAPAADKFILNFEPRVERGTCDDCRKSFAAYAKLPAVPQRAELYNKHNVQWQKFKVEQRRKLMKRMADTVHRLLPGMQIGFCSSVPRVSGEHLRDWCCVDPQLVDAEADFFSNMLYCSGLDYYNLLCDSKKLLKSPQFSLIDPAEQDIRWFSRYSPEKVRQNFITSMLLRAEGMVFYPEDCFDGRYLSVISSTANALAQVENLFRQDAGRELKYEVLNSVPVKIQGKDTTLSLQSPDFQQTLKVHLNKNGADYVATLLNFNSSDAAFVKIAIPSYAVSDAGAVELLTMTDCAVKNTGDIKNGFTVKVAPNGSALIKIAPRRHLPPPHEIRQITGMERELAADLAANRAKAALYQAQKQGGQSYHWELNGKELLLRLNRADSSVAIAPDSGGVIRSWRNAAGYDPVSYRNEVMEELSFYDPTQEKSPKFTVRDISFGPRGISCTLSYRIMLDTQAGGSANPLEGLQLDKTLTMTDDNGSLETVYKFTNNNTEKKSMTFGFRIKNVPFHVWPTTHEAPQVTLGGQLFARVNSQTYLKPGQRIEWSGAAHTLPCPDDSSVEFKRGKERLIFQHPWAAGVYFWHAYAIDTVEPLSPMLTLKHGETIELKTQSLRRASNQP